ncbi:hypothetical protein HON52_00390 [Candidatus Uhrbacteria bacterium]|jgi:protein required for attachment to host cells|nr:hypothetical protein [Candidatus Uhrbacteria bacterium]
MQISNHYLGYPKRTLIVVTNNEVAKIFRAFEKEIEEIEVLEGEEIESPGEGSSPSDEVRHRVRQDLYKDLNKKLMVYVQGEDEEILLCAPEAHKNALVEEMHPDVMKMIVEVIPKNLASLPLDAIVRILQETSL